MASGTSGTGAAGSGTTPKGPISWAISLLLTTLFVALLLKVLFGSYIPLVLGILVSAGIWSYLENSKLFGPAISDFKTLAKGTAMAAAGLIVFALLVSIAGRVLGIEWSDLVAEWGMHGGLYGLLGGRGTAGQLRASMFYTCALVGAIALVWTIYFAPEKGKKFVTGIGTIVVVFLMVLLIAPATSGLLPGVKDGDDFVTSKITTSEWYFNKRAAVRQTEVKEMDQGVANTLRDKEIKRAKDRIQAIQTDPALNPCVARGGFCPAQPLIDEVRARTMQIAHLHTARDGEIVVRADNRLTWTPFRVQPGSRLEIKETVGEVSVLNTGMPLTGIAYYAWQRSGPYKVLYGAVLLVILLLLAVLLNGIRTKRLVRGTAGAIGALVVLTLTYWLTPNTWISTAYATPDGAHGGYSCKDALQSARAKGHVTGKVSCLRPIDPIGQLMIGVLPDGLPPISDSLTHVQAIGKVDMDDPRAPGLTVDFALPPGTTGTVVLFANDYYEDGKSIAGDSGNGGSFRVSIVPPTVQLHASGSPGAYGVKPVNVPPSPHVYVPQTECPKAYFRSGDGSCHRCPDGKVATEDGMDCTTPPAGD